MGKMLIDKLLRTCPGIENIYLLVRPKKGKDIHTRLDEIFDDLVIPLTLFIIRLKFAMFNYAFRFIVRFSKGYAKRYPNFVIKLWPSAVIVLLLD